MTEHQDLENSVAAFVLGASEPEEADELREHIRACASCRQLAGRLSRAVDALPLEAAEVKPPDRLRARILEAAAASPRAAAAPTAPTRAKVLTLPRRAGFFSGFSMPRTGYAAAVAALTVSVLALGGWDIGLTQQLNQGSAAHYAITGTGSMANSAASVTSFQREGITLVDFRGMPQPTAGRVYELWMVDKDGKPIPGPVFSPEPDGSKVLLVSRNLNGMKALAVTTEPGPTGSAQPSEPAQMVGRII